MNHAVTLANVQLQLCLVLLGERKYPSREHSLGGGTLVRQVREGFYELKQKGQVRERGGSF